MAMSEGVEGLTSDVPKSESVVGQSIAATSASGGEGGTSTASAMTRDQAATVIQKQWRRFYTERKHDIDTMNALLSSMGEPVRTKDDFVSNFTSGGVVVQVRGTPGVPMQGHSSFYFNNGVYEMLQSRDNMVSTRYKAKYPTYIKVGNRAIPFERTFISEEILDKEERENLSGKIQHLIDVGRLFALRPQYSAQFSRAFQQERFSFIHQQYSYGLHYNCHHFALAVLRRLLDLSH
jgi:hypothetical protein